MLGRPGRRGRRRRVSPYSPSTARILGYEPDDLIGESAFSYITPRPRDVHTLYRETVEDPDIVARRAESRFRPADGDWVWLEADGSNRARSPIDGCVINAGGLSERKALEQELRREKRRVQQVVCVIARDLRSSLTIAATYLDTAVASGDFSLLEAVDEELERMERIVANTPSTARVDPVEQNADFVAVSSVAKPVWSRCPANGDDSRSPKTCWSSGYTTDPTGTGLGLAIVRAVAIAHRWTCRVTEGDQRALAPSFQAPRLRERRAPAETTRSDSVPTDKTGTENR